MTEKEKYRQLCAEELSIPIYSRDWWLDCVCGEVGWDVLLCCREGEIEASMPFYSPCKGVIFMPPYTQAMGVWFNPSFEDKSYSKDLYRKQTVCENFIKQLPSSTYFSQSFHYSFTDWLPFYWKGYRQTTRYTYLLSDIENKDVLWKNLNENVRRNIQKARDKYKLEVRKNVDINQFVEITDKTFIRQGLRPYHPDFLKRLIEYSRKRNQGDIWGAYDVDGRLHTAVFVVWQKNNAYYIAGGGDPELRQSGAHALTLWEAINEVSQHSTSFDFEGSMIKGVEHFFRGFGAKQMPYFVVEKGKMSPLKRFQIKIFRLCKW
ncbi:MAG: GNAT family N-acetyltransferase [Bacteroidales bacterium]|jgi:lipid II:glycine glycyltransferase (peptidoglycan interpeptide bridge formation enzyme)|nr:GNAT family N-acetyltransferase [Bacteroidales bacterium]